jgi:hypothetical protein
MQKVTERGASGTRATSGFGTVVSPRPLQLLAETQIRVQFHST